MPTSVNAFIQGFCVAASTGVERMFCSSSAVVIFFPIVHLVLPPDTKVFMCTLHPRQKIRSGHIHWENWGVIINHISHLSHQSDCSGKVNYIYTPPQVASFFVPEVTPLVTDNVINTTMTDCHTSTGSSFSNESVQTLFFGGCLKNLVWGWRLLCHVIMVCHVPYN